MKKAHCESTYIESHEPGEIINNNFIIRKERLAQKRFAYEYLNATFNNNNTQNQLVKLLDFIFSTRMKSSIACDYD